MNRTNQPTTHLSKRVRAVRRPNDSKEGELVGFPLRDRERGVSRRLHDCELRTARESGAHKYKMMEG